VISVLIVEDDPLIAEAHRTYLARLEGFSNAAVAHTAREAMQIATDASASDTPIDLVLLDLGLPDASGLTGLREILDIAGRAAVCVLTGLEAEPLGFPADLRFEYSNANYLVLGSILERVSKRDLDALLRDRILSPLHLDDTGFGIPSGGDAASGCGTTPWGVASVPSFDPELTWAAGGMYSSAADMARFESALLGAHLFPARALATMLASRDGYGFAWFVYPNGPDRIAWHDGTVYGYKAVVVAIPARRDVVVVLANADYFHATRVATQVADVVFGTSMPVAEGFDPALPQWSLTIGGLAGLCAIGAAFVRRRRMIVGIAGGVAAYCAASLAWPVAIAIALVAVLVVLAPTSRTSRSRSASTNRPATPG